MRMGNSGSPSAPRVRGRQTDRVATTSYARKRQIRFNAISITEGCANNGDDGSRALPSPTSAHKCHLMRLTWMPDKSGRLIAVSPEEELERIQLHLQSGVLPAKGEPAPRQTEYSPRKATPQTGRRTPIPSPNHEQTRSRHIVAAERADGRAKESRNAGDAAGAAQWEETARGHRALAKAARQGRR